MAGRDIRPICQPTEAQGPSRLPLRRDTDLLAYLHTEHGLQDHEGQTGETQCSFTVCLGECNGACTQQALVHGCIRDVLSVSC